ncbi:type II toxin-antitoxin system HipA family toxin [Maridesulfovibrio ferrireducens]|uniref:type II toxin-antitoxin system HipA family toxin n=1 Tax=Maridesulfovibrio ferrireducens TaxID=246191 RepID=UPI001A32C28B|nr:type II toxin-antitoxin system HipA family toxin [Maridesulfovibrio ferrireducens]MBI9113343.1 type II toxin-antitoxin system HipA family toxin [Maridesulfovibrio ferrireducens]
MSIDSTYVYIHINGEFVPVGILKITHNDQSHFSEFNYGRKYLTRNDAIPVDPIQLPLTAQKFQTQGIFGAFQDAMPDGWGTHLLDRAAEEFGYKPKEIDYLTVLDQDNRTGALAFGPDLNGPQAYTPKWRPQIIPGESLNLTEMLETADKIFNDDELNPNQKRFLIRGSSVGGAQPKAAVDYEGRKWIAKFSRELEFWPTCRIELAAMRMAAQCSIRVPQCKIIEINKRDIFLIERFDRKTDNSRIHFISAMTLTGAKSMTEGTYGDIARAMRKYIAIKYLDKDLEEMFRRMVFNILCNNHDDHLKNHGFLYDSQSGMWRLSPAYDIVPQPQMRSDDKSYLTLAIGSQGHLATLENALSRCEDFRLQRNKGTTIVEQMAKYVKENWKNENIKAGVSKTKIYSVQQAYKAAEI